MKAFALTSPFLTLKSLRNIGAPVYQLPQTSSIQGAWIHSAFQSELSSIPVVQRAGSLKGEGLPSSSQTMTVHQYSVMGASRGPEYSTRWDSLESTLPESHRSGRPLASFSAEVATISL